MNMMGEYPPLSNIEILRIRLQRRMQTVPEFIWPKWTLTAGDWTIPYDEDEVTK